jgi:hypothetical protein
VLFVWAMLISVFSLLLYILPWVLTSMFRVFLRVW